MGKFYKQMEALYDMAAFSWAAEHASMPDTLAASLDGLITSKDRIEQIVAQAIGEAQKRRHKTRYTEGIIHDHIKFRIQQASRNKKAR